MEKENLTVKHFILFHAIRVPVATKADDHKSFILAHNSLVNMPACDKMGKDDGAHDDCMTVEELSEGMR